MSSFRELFVGLVFYRGIIKQKLLTSEFIISRIFQHHQYSNMESSKIWMNMFICIVGENLDWKEKRDMMLTFLSATDSEEPRAMICTLGSFCPRMSAKIRLLVLVPSSNQNMFHLMGPLIRPQPQLINWFRKKVN